MVTSKSWHFNLIVYTTFYRFAVYSSDFVIKKFSRLGGNAEIWHHCVHIILRWMHAFKRNVWRTVSITVWWWYYRWLRQVHIRSGWLKRMYLKSVIFSTMAKAALVALGRGKLCHNLKYVWNYHVKHSCIHVCAKRYWFLLWRKYSIEWLSIICFILIS